MANIYMQRKPTPTRLHIISHRPAKPSHPHLLLDPSPFTSSLQISKAPVHRNQPKEVTTSELDAANSLLRRRNTKLTSVTTRQIFEELRTQFERKQKQIARMRDMAEFVGVIRASEQRSGSIGVRGPVLVQNPQSPQSEYESLRNHVHKLEQAVTELRLELFKAKQEYDQLKDWLGQLGLDESSDHFVPAFDIDAMTYEELLALEERIGYVKVGLSSSDLQRLPKVAISKENAEELCCVCLQQFEIDTEAKQLPACGHLFHGACIDEWLDKKKTCPLCVTEVRV
jgi:hypothetical protein